jgi:HSP20 family protein
MNLKKWFPFKFERKSAETKQAEAKVAEPAAPPSAELAPRFPMTRMMEEFFGDPWLKADPFALLRSPLWEERWFGDFSPAFFRPSIDVVDEGAYLTVNAELPGMTQKDVELSVHEGVLTLKGEKKVEETKEENGCYRTERSYGKFTRTIPLPTDVKTETAEATFDGGILKIRFPKVEPKQIEAKKIAIKA